MLVYCFGKDAKSFEKVDCPSRGGTKRHAVRS